MGFGRPVAAGYRLPTPVWVEPVRGKQSRRGNGVSRVRSLHRTGLAAARKARCLLQGGSRNHRKNQAPPVWGLAPLPVWQVCTCISISHVLFIIVLKQVNQTHKPRSAELREGAPELPVQCQSIWGGPCDLPEDGTHPRQNHRQRGGLPVEPGYPPQLLISLKASF